MNLTHVAGFIGKTGLLLTREGLSVAVTVTDATTAYGNLRLCVEPVTGGGSAYVNADRVTFGDEQ